jgi:hypothetical protein
MTPAVRVKPKLYRQERQSAKEEKSLTAKTQRNEYRAPNKMKVMERHPHPNLPPEGEGGTLSSSGEAKSSLPLRGRARVGVVLDSHFVRRSKNKNAKTTPRGILDTASQRKFPRNAV